MKQTFEFGKTAKVSFEYGVYEMMTQQELAKAIDERGFPEYCEWFLTEDEATAVDTAFEVKNVPKVEPKSLPSAMANR